MNVLFLSHTLAGGPFRVGSHHLSRELSRAGFTVWHVSTPVSLGHVAYVLRPSVRARLAASVRSPWEDEAGTQQLVPRCGPPINSRMKPVRDVAVRQTVKGVRRLMNARGLAHFDAAFVDQPLLGPVAEALKINVLIYRPTDAHFHEPERSAEQRLVAIADGVVATSQVVLDGLSTMRPETPRMVLENGVEHRRFCEVAPPIRSGAIYVGALDHRIHWELLQRLADAYPDLSFRLAGPIVRGVVPLLPPNVELLGAVPYEELPTLLASASVGLLPFNGAAINAGRSPMKYYEYLASGLNVLGRSSPTLQSRRAPGVWLYDDIPEAVGALGQIRELGPNEPGVQYAAAHDWSRKAERLLAFVDRVRS